MFNDYESSGKHMICDFKNIKNDKLLNDINELDKVLKDICFEHNFQILKEVKYSFTPIGCSIIFLLSESHLSVHTFPEKSHMSFDIYTCRQYTNNNHYLQIYDQLVNKLQASKDISNCKIIDRYF